MICSFVALNVLMVRLVKCISLKGEYQTSLREVTSFAKGGNLIASPCKFVTSLLFTGKETKYFFPSFVFQL